MTDHQDDHYNSVLDPRTGRPPLPIETEKMREKKQMTEDMPDADKPDATAPLMNEDSDAPVIDQEPGRMHSPRPGEADTDDPSEDSDFASDENDADDADDADEDLDESDEEDEEGELDEIDPEDPFNPRTGP